MHSEIGSYEAKTKLPELIRSIQEGNSYTITLRGEPVADLVPSSKAPKNDVASAVAEMLEFMESRHPIPGIDIKALIEDGRD